MICQCDTCENDCYRYQNDNNCINYVEAKPVTEYLSVIREENKNLHKICFKYKLKYSILKKALYEKIRFPYKYRTCLENELFSKRDFWENYEFKKGSVDD